MKNIKNQIFRTVWHSDGSFSEEPETLFLEEIENPLADSPPELEENPFVDCLNQTSEKLKILLSVVDKVQNPSLAVSLPEICTILEDLGLSLQNQDVERHLNDEVLEDPLNRGDALGNVLMLHKKQQRTQSELPKFLGQGLVQLAASILKADQFQIRGEEILRDIEDFQSNYQIDDQNSENILDAKKRIMMLRKDNEKLDRRNKNLYIRLRKLIPKKEQIKIVPVSASPFSYKVDSLSSKNTSSDSSEHLPSDNSCSREDGMPKHQTRNLVKAQNADSQVDFEW